jgi:1,4-dihydroxy-6-naphthoate synthase
MKLSLGFSPCPNDTFIFDALVNKKIDTKGIDIDTYIEDVETLNEWAFQRKLDITKLSYAAYFSIINEYILLNSGSALGKGVGPLLIAKHPIELSSIKDSTIAIPGENTTANMLFSLAFPNAKNKIFLRYNEIENCILNPFSFGIGQEQVIGVIIHENRFTYQQKGLVKVMDLGEYWEAKTQLPIPLGGIAIKRSIPLHIQQTVDGLIKESVLYAFKYYPQLSPFVIQHAQTMQEPVMRQHIDLYVNKYSIDLGNEGRNAIEIMAKHINHKNIFDINRLFLNSA